MVPFSFAGHDLLALGSGALFWPVRRAVLVADQPVIQAHHLLLPNVRPAAAPVLRTAADTLERQMIEEALRNSAGSQVRSAELLGTSERVLRYKLRKFGIDRRMFKRAAG